MDESELERLIGDKPIQVPGNPFRGIAVTFGAAEMASLVVGVAGTAGLDYALNNNLLPFATSPEVQTLMLALVSPVIEKVGLVGFPLVKCVKEYLEGGNCMDRPELWKYLSGGLKQGLANIGRDISAHDPLYSIMMGAGLLAMPQIPSGVWSFVSFVTALGLVVVGEVGLKEAAYALDQYKLKKAGFKPEKYLETRFYVGTDEPLSLLEKMSTRFGLESDIMTGEYRDRYFSTRGLHGYNGRTPALRLRQRASETPTEGLKKSMQIIHTRASEIARKAPEQYRYFPVEKDKFWAPLGQSEMPWTTEKIENPTLRRIHRQATTGECSDVRFSRSAVQNPKTILVSVDNVNSHNGNLYVVEIKSWKDTESIRVLVDAMRYVMMEYPVWQTTHGKARFAMPGDGLKS